MNDDEMIRHLEQSRLAGVVATTVANTRSKIAGLFDGDPRCTFGMSRCASATPAEIEEALLATAGARLAEGGEGYIDPRKTMEGLRRHATALAPFLTRGGGAILIATGHPAGMLGHYIALARRLAAAGNTLLRPCDDGPLIPTPFEAEPDASIRFIGGVGCVYRKPGSLVHSHLAHYMESMLDAMGGPPDLVIGDHGMAGAALERRIPTVSIADVNDIPLHLAWTDDIQSLLVIDDNLPPHVFGPVTDYILEAAEDHEH